MKIKSQNPQNEFYQKISDASERFETSKNNFITTLAQRPCSALDYLYGQCLAAVVARDIAQAQDLMRNQNTNFDYLRLFTEIEILDNLDKLFDAVLANHPQAAAVYNYYWELDEARRDLANHRRNIAKKTGQPASDASDG